MEIKNKLYVVGSKGKADLSAPGKFESEIQKFLNKKVITKQQFLKLCKRAVYYHKKFPQKSQGIAYLITSVWLVFSNKQRGLDIDEIGQEFGHLELPNHLLKPSLKKAWNRVLQLAEKL